MSHHLRFLVTPSAKSNSAADGQSVMQQQPERTFKPCGCETSADAPRAAGSPASPPIPLVQTKSATTAHDVHEREADRIAEAMVRASGPKTRCSTCGGSHEVPEVQRKSLGAGTPPASPPQHALQSGGQPLASPTRAFFEPRFGYDFGQVRVHSDARASEVARSYSASALTAGTHIWFGAGQLDTSSQAGRQLIAHELAHVVQQSLFPGSIDGRTVEPTNSAAEREASAAADDVAAGREANKISAVPRGIARDVGWASRGEIPDPWGIGFNTIYKKAGPESKQAVLALSALTTPRMFVDLEAYKKLPLPMRKAVLALEPHAAGTGCAGWFDLMRANDPDLKPKYTAEELAAGEAAYHSANREVAVAHKVEQAKQAAPALTGMDVEKQWRTNKYGLITSAQTPNHGIKADALHAIWINYWAEKIKLGESIVDAMDQTQLHDPKHPDPSDDPGYRQAKAMSELGRFLLADTVGAIEICRFADSVGKSLTLDELDKQVIEHSKFMERMQLLLMVLTSIGPRGAPKGGKKPPQPGKGISVKPEPIKTEPIKTEPIKTEPVKTEPVKTEPVKTEPVKTEPVKTEPVKTEESVKTEPVKTEAKPSDPAKTEEPAKTEPVAAKSSKHGYTGEWPPPEPGPRPKNASATDMAKWRYKRYARDAYNAGKTQGEILTEEGYKPYANVADKPGARPGRGGGPAQQETRKGPAAKEGYTNTETKQLGSRTNPETGEVEGNFVDGFREEKNANGGTDYLEVDDMNKNGLPAAKIRPKLKSEIQALEPGDRLEFWDKYDHTRRIQYEAGEDPNVVDSRRGPTQPRKPPTPKK